MRTWTRSFKTVTALGATMLAVACTGGEAKDAESEAAEGRVRAVNVEVMDVALGSFQEVLRVTGVVRANRDVVVSAEESGRITAVIVDKGANVRPGQPLLKIDDGILRSQVEQAQAVADLARETHERRKRLWEEDRVGSELAYLQARYEAEQAAANLETLRQRLARTTVRAPIGGILEDRRVEVGSMVAPGTPLARIVDISPVKVTGGVPERFAQHVGTGRTVSVSLDAMGGPPSDATVSFVGSTVDEHSRTFPIEVQLPNPGGLIKPEMVATIRLPLREIEEAVVIPQQALVRAEGGFLAYVVIERDGELVAEQRSVTVGPSGGNRTVVTSGIEAGDRLIVVGQQKVADGDAVAVSAERQGGPR